MSDDPGYEPLFIYRSEPLPELIPGDPRSIIAAAIAGDAARAYGRREVHLRMGGAMPVDGTDPGAARAARDAWEAAGAVLAALDAADLRVTRRPSPIHGHHVTVALDPPAPSFAAGLAAGYAEGYHDGRRRHG